MTSENTHNPQEIRRLLDEVTAEIELQTQQCGQLNQYIKDAAHNRRALEACCLSINQSIASASRSRIHKMQADILMGDAVPLLGLIFCDRQERMAELLDLQAKIARDEFNDNAQLIASLKDVACKAEERLKQNRRHENSLRQKLERLSSPSSSGQGHPHSVAAFRKVDSELSPSSETRGMCEAPAQELDGHWLDCSQCTRMDNQRIPI